MSLGLYDLDMVAGFLTKVGREKNIKKKELPQEVCCFMGLSHLTTQTIPLPMVRRVQTKQNKPIFPVPCGDSQIRKSTPLSNH